MDKLKPLAVAALALVFIWYLLPVSTPPTVTQGGGQGVPQVGAAVVPEPKDEPTGVPTEAATATRPLKVQTQAAIGSSTPSSGARNRTYMPELTRPLEQVQTVQMAGREWSVLGTNEVVNERGKQSVLVLRDELSGQLDYRQSALRVVLREGEDYESFIKALPHATRLFVNPLYGEFSVDAAYIGAQYIVLASDRRVLQVNFIPLAVPARPR
ncbi:MAG: hypothetical protein ACOYNZ_03130 [Rhodoferax sp.]